MDSIPPETRMQRWSVVPMTIVFVKSNVQSRLRDPRTANSWLLTLISMIVPAVGAGYRRLLMKINALILPRDLVAADINHRTVVVFDVLRATTSITAALAAGVREVRVFDSLEGAMSAANAFGQPRLLCGERHTLPPPGFDLGNSPGQFDAAKHSGMTVFMSTTNGTRAIVAAKSAALVLCGALVNAAGVAKQLKTAGHDVTLLCSGSDGQPSMEDLLGAGAVIDASQQLGAVELTDDLSRVAVKLYDACRKALPAVLADTYGGHNIRRVHLDADIAFAARLDALNTVGRVIDEPLRVVVQAPLDGR